MLSVRRVCGKRQREHIGCGQSRMWRAVGRPQHSVTSPVRQPVPPAHARHQRRSQGLLLLTSCELHAPHGLFCKYAATVVGRACCQYDGSVGNGNGITPTVAKAGCGGRWAARNILLKAQYGNPHRLRNSRLQRLSQEFLLVMSC